MSTVRCRGCGLRKARDDCIRVGLGWCCDADCRSKVPVRPTRDLDTVQRTTADDAKKTRTWPTAKIKAKVKERDGGRCRFCGTAAGLHVHHVVYRSEGGKHGERNLLTLCLTCHERVHANKWRYQPVLVELLRLQYDEDRYLTVPQVSRLM